MNDNHAEVNADLIDIINRIREHKIYGSVEIYFEEGEVTQVTQRIISKIQKKSVKKKTLHIRVSASTNQNAPHVSRSTGLE